MRVLVFRSYLNPQFSPILVHIQLSNLLSFFLSPTSNTQGTRLHKLSINLFETRKHLMSPSLSAILTICTTRKALLEWNKTYVRHRCWRYRIFIIYTAVCHVAFKRGEKRTLNSIPFSRGTLHYTSENLLLVAYAPSLSFARSALIYTPRSTSLSLISRPPTHFSAIRLLSSRCRRPRSASTPILSSSAPLSSDSSPSP